MKAIFSALGAGLLFGLGLTISGLINPSKVLGFLDIAGAWDPTLLFVMGGAVTVYFVAHRFVLKAQRPAFALSFDLPTRTDFDTRLVAGAAIFGLGWGIVGFCPGPALAAIAVKPSVALIFFGAMVAGMVIYQFLPRPRMTPTTASR